MAGKNIDINLRLDDRDAQRSIKDINRELGKTEDAFEDTESAGKQMARAIEAATAQTVAEIEQAERAVKAMELALDGVDMDPQQVVGDLKRMGLTLEAIETDAEDLARAVQGIDQVRVSAERAGFSDLNKVMGDTETSGRGASVAIGGIGGSISELPGVGTLGPIAESMGQLAEGALEGEIGLKGLIGTAGGLAAVAFVASKVGAHFDRIAEHEAWKTEQVDSYTEALRETESVAGAVEQKLRDADEIVLQLGQGMMEIDLMPGLQAAGVDVEQFSRLVAGGEEAIAAYEQKMIAAGVPIEQYGAVIVAARQESEFLTKAQEAAGVSAEFFADTEDAAADAAENAADKLEHQTEVLEGHRDALKESTEALEEQLDAQLSLADSSYVLEKAQFDLTDTVTAANEVFGDAEASADDYRKAELDVIDSANGVAEAQVRQREETAKANGTTLTAKQRMDAMNGSLLTTAGTLNGPARQAVLDHIARLNGIPPEKMTEIQAAVDRGDLATAETLINGASRTRNTAIGVTANQWDLANLDAQINGIINRPRSVRFTAVGANRAAAKGTPYSPGGSTLVGEEGPEVVDLPPGAAVTDAQASKGRINRMGAGGQGGAGNTYITHVTQHFPAGTNPTDVARANRLYTRRNGPT